MEIGIVGLGLIGGSLAIDFRNRGHRVLGVSRKLETCQQAIEQQIVEEASLDLALLANSEVIFLCTPIGALVATVQQLVPHLTTATILTDVGSVKATVVEQLAPLWPNFVGGHPMAGKAESGLSVAQADLFVDRAYVLTPTDTTALEAIATVTGLVQTLGCRIYRSDPAAHDRAVAWISHLPVMVSATLIEACLQESDAAVLELAQKFSSSGFRDTSRVGGGNPELGVMMARYNRSALLQALQAYRQQLDSMIETIEQTNWQGLEQQLIRTQQGRSNFSGT